MAWSMRRRTTVMHLTKRIPQTCPFYWGPEHTLARRPRPWLAKARGGRGCPTARPCKATACLGPS
eukprot:11492395-Alexandrium_andersonii.AAC.1